LYHRGLKSSIFI